MRSPLTQETLSKARPGWLLLITLHKNRLCIKLRLSGMVRPLPKKDPGGRPFRPSSTPLYYHPHPGPFSTGFLQGPWKNQPEIVIDGNLKTLWPTREQKRKKTFDPRPSPEGVQKEE